jgi:hypothetical protein
MFRRRISASAATELASGVTLTTGPREDHPTSATVDFPNLPRLSFLESKKRATSDWEMMAEKAVPEASKSCFFFFEVVFRVFFGSFW